MPKSFWVLTAVIAFVLTAVRLPRGFAMYFRVGGHQEDAAHLDADRRWQELHYILREKNPYDVAFAYIPRAHAIQPAKQAASVRDARPEPDLGLPEGVVYPPWAYLTEIPFFWLPGKKQAEIYYAVIMAAGLALIFWWARSEVNSGAAPMGAAVGLASVAAGSWVFTVFVGNNPLLVVPLLAVHYWLVARRRNWAAGVILGMALLKPTIAGPFLFVLVLRRRWSSIATCLIYLVLASLFTWLMTATSPLEMLGQMMAASKQWTAEGFGPAQYLMHAGLPAPTATILTGAVVAILGCWALFLARNGTLLGQFAIAAITARFWSYHLFYDDAVLIFALVFFARETLSFRPRTAAVGFILSCVGLWVPYRFVLSVAVQVLQLLIWFTLACLVVSLSRSEERNLIIPSAGQPVSPRLTT